MFSEFMSNMLSKGKGMFGSAMDGLENIGNNPLAIQYMAAAGNDLLSGNPIGKNVNDVTAKTIQSRSYAGLLSKMLEGGGKMTIDAENTNIKFPSGVMSSALQPPIAAPSPTPSPNMVDSGNGAPINTIQKSTPNVLPQNSVNSSNTPNSNKGMNPMSMFLNPSSSPLNITNSDLVGLSPQDISSIFQLKNASEELKNKGVSNYYDNLLKQAQVDQINNREVRTDPLDNKYPVAVPGLGEVTLRQWKELPNDQKQYAAYVTQATKLGDSDIMDREEFNLKFNPTEREKFLTSLKDNPELLALEKELNKSKATNINIGDRTKERIKAEQQAKIEGPGYTSKISSEMKQSNSREWNKPTNTDKHFNEILRNNNIDKKNLTPEQELSYRKQAKKYARAELLVDRLISDLKAAYDGEVTLGRDGFYVDGVKKLGYYTDANLN